MVITRRPESNLDPKPDHRLSASRATVPRELKFKGGVGTQILDQRSSSGRNTGEWVPGSCRIALPPMPLRAPQGGPRLALVLSAEVVPRARILDQWHAYRTSLKQPSVQLELFEE
jgi:hypothetical protein